MLLSACLDLQEVPDFGVDFGFLFKCAKVVDGQI